MNKKIVSLLIAAAMLVPSAAAFAADEVKTAEPTAVEAVEKNNDINKYTGVVMSYQKNILSVEIDGAEVPFGVVEDTPVYALETQEKAEVKVGDEVIVFSEASLKTKDIKDVKALIIGNEEKLSTSVKMSVFSEGESGLTSADDELVINVKEDLKKEYEGKELLVFYNMMTMSIPAQTSPLNIVVLDSEDSNNIKDAEKDDTKDTKDTENKDEKDDDIKDTEDKEEKTESESVELSFNIGDSVLNINGSKTEVEKPYVTDEGITLVPLRVISEAFGAKVDWEEEAKTVTISSGSKNIQLQIGKNTAVVDADKNVDLESAPQLTENGFAMIPLRFISENLGLTVTYDEKNQGVSVTGVLVK